MFFNKIFDTATLQCELCKNITPKRSAYICESGHTICINCDGDLNDTREVSEKDNSNEIKTDNEYNAAHYLAGGDYIKIKSNKAIDEKVRRKTSKYKHEGTDKTNYVKKNISRTSNKHETTVVYKNLGFDNNESVKSLINSPISTNNEIEKINIRPITCPMSHCKKTVAFNSILKHFNFDHSEIATLPINIKKTLKIYLKPINLSKDTKCVAIINPIGSKATLLLMAAKVHASHAIQEDRQSENNLNTNLGLPDKNGDADLDIKQVKETQEDIIIWICRLTEFKQLCSIKVKRDNILGYSYIGEGLDISQNQEPTSVFKSPECLLLRYYSIYKLLDDQKQIHVYINVLK
ncbi:PREDICTED: uncharacterized protein LOC106125095 [Papilio xuthus]|uniref:Uncharacterized protein LOC106125095 n=1 Tax=Papilio xuthus TaxID=66420 RepID=A0AAJ7EHJ7_PAPXU|nr:PREDICTED: uncharacterized protein LOC106125095 [Papilio xuthus]